ncbi:MAG: type II toxin-antitoxin system RelE/ParE family toxin [Deltaproteobacteria bacterium]|nr:type II toxin-antitoxin system RelE/ParE family toxin [Deltaproteobacteria bacterium]
MKVEIAPGLLKEIRKLDKKLRERFYKVVEKLVANPEVGKPLQYDFKGCRRVRMDPFRVIYKVKEDTIFIMAFDHRGTVYK